jgi:hypothetical protein
MITVGAGVVPSELLEPLARIHDGMPQPRALVWLAGEGASETPALPGISLIHGHHADRIVDLVHDLRAGRRSSSPPLLADEDPAEWRGVGPYGQGGSGMTGGVPYGRPMASLAPDRDGLRLDRLPTSVGPWFPFLPAGLRLRVGFAGDVLSGVQVELPPDVPGLPAPRDVFHRALREPVAIAELEHARVRSHLRALALALDASGLGALARSVRRSAADHRLDEEIADHIERRLRWSGFIGWHTGGVGRLDPELLRGRGLGPTTRAAGLVEDSRTTVAAYLDAGFHPEVEERSDAAARWRCRIREIGASLRLATAARDLRVGPLGSVEAPRGRISEGGPVETALELVPDAIEGLEWGEALTTLLSLDLGEEAYAPVVPAGARA